jgi:hypothetical protein
VTDAQTLIYELALHALQQQERNLAEIRSRTSTLLAAAALVASFLGAASIREAGISAWAVLAFAMFAANGALGLAVLWPWDLRFELDVRIAYDRISPWLENAPLAYTRTAFLLTSRYRRNQAGLARLEGLFRAAVVTLGLQSLFWTLALGIA